MLCGKLLKGARTLRGPLPPYHARVLYPYSPSSPVKAELMLKSLKGPEGGAVLTPTLEEVLLPVSQKRTEVERLFHVYTFQSRTM